MAEFPCHQSEQARNENDNYWNNLWNTVKNIGSAALTAYDGYKGYTQQQWENDFAREQWEYNKNRTDQSDALSAYQQAFNLYTQGAGDAASDVLNRYGLNANAFANYNGAPVTRDDQASVLTTAASLVANGNSEAAANLLKMYGLDSNAAGDYNTLTQRALSAALAKRAGTGSGGSRGYYRQSSEWSKSELRNLMKDRESVAAKGGDTTWYDGILADAGYPVPETKNTEKSKETDSGLIAPLANPNKWALPGGTTGGSMGKSASTGMPYSNALSYAKGWKEQGMDANTIASRLMNLGASDDVIDRAMQNAGF